MSLQIIAFACIATVQCGLAPAAYISPYASTYNAHTINHAVAAPVFAPAAKIISPYAAAPFVASPYAAAPFVASPYAAAPFAASPYGAAKIVSPYAASPYAALPYSSPYSSPYAYSPYAHSANYLL